MRIEELINYFDYDYPDPSAGDPFGIVTEIADCPWAPAHQLVHIGLRSEAVAIADLPPNNLVFLLDVSGSMNSADKLPLLKKAFSLLVAGPHVQEPFRYFRDVEAQLPYPVFSLLPAFEQSTEFPLFFRDDPHWMEQMARNVTDPVEGCACDAPAI